jgi:hypothetical protein
VNPQDDEGDPEGDQRVGDQRPTATATALATTARLT